MHPEPRETDWYAEACRRARASARRRRHAGASTDLPQFAPPVALSSGPLGAVQAADREIGRQTALRARAVTEFAAGRPSTDDRAQGEPGAMSPERWAARPEILRPVSEWAGRELMIALSISAEAADALLTRSLTLVDRLPGTLAALEAGALHPGHLWTMLEKVAPIADARIRAEVEAELLRWSAGRVVPPAQLAAKARREVARRDARSAARRLQKVLKERGVYLRPHTDDGMATVTVVATMPEAQALYRALCECAKTLDDDGDARTRGQKLVDCLLDLVLRPGETDLPPVQVLLTVVASIATLAGSDDPGEVDGQVVPAEMIRQLLAALTAAQQSDADAMRDAAALRQRSADDVPWQEAEQDELSRWWAEMERRVLSGELVDPDPWPEDLPDDWASGLSSCDWPPEWTLEDAALAAHREPGGRRQTFRQDAPYSAAAGGEPSRPVPADRSAESVPSDRPSAPAESEQSSGDTGWWAAADRAVDDAGRALFEAVQKVAHAQRLVRTAAVADSDDENAWQSGPAGRVNAADDALGALRSATDTRRQQIADLLATTGGGGLADRPRIALTDALSGALLALTDLPGLVRAGTCGRVECRRNAGSCSHDLGHRPRLGPPGPTDGYRPSAELDRWMRARDRRCRLPGCRRRVPRGGELDHARPFPLGPTSAGNLVGYCTTDHRGKHQAPGWRHELEPDGTLIVTTPTGLVAATCPQPY